jgi:hypothetical protein
MISFDDFTSDAIIPGKAVRLRSVTVRLLPETRWTGSVCLLAETKSGDIPLNWQVSLVARVVVQSLSDFRAGLIMLSGVALWDVPLRDWRWNLLATLTLRDAFWIHGAGDR